MTILYYPSVDGNPYWEMIRSRMEARGFQTNLWNPWDFPQKAQPILHLHWIESIGMDRLTRRSLLATRIAFHRLENQIRLVQRCGGKVLWTAHNAQPHEQRSDPRSQLVAQWISRIAGQVDIIVSLSSIGVEAIRRAQPQAKAPVTVIPHQNYIGQYPVGDGAAYRQSVGIAPDARVMGMIGLIRPYKEIERGIKLFSNITDERTWLLVAGNCFDPALRERLSALAQQTPRVKLVISHLSDQQFADAHAACDLILVAQRKMLNSGSVISALSLDAPVLSSPIGALPELQDMVGADWLTLKEDITSEDVAALLARGRPVGKPDLALLDIDRIVDAHLQAYGLQK
jgi:glycosyltransferase involved in cell wall biosynthesis